MRRQRWWFLGVFVQIGHILRKDFPVTIGQLRQFGCCCGSGRSVFFWSGSSSSACTITHYVVGTGWYSRTGGTPICTTYCSCCGRSNGRYSNSGSGSRSSCSGSYWSGPVFCSGFFLFKITITGVGFELGDINKIVDPSLNIGYSRLVGCKPPFVINNKFKRVFATFKVVNIGKIVTTAVHRNLTAPAIECPGNVDLASTVFPTKDSRDSVII
mmetsp:Transcript_18452/g.26521  ORF Transcript_18452/g.26521 Transcript_18452/m.26521 type:complete len:213 (+) Transcript_18452:362-1000(+)